MGYRSNVFITLSATGLKQFREIAAKPGNAELVSELMSCADEAREYADGSCAMSWMDVKWYESPPEASTLFGSAEINLIMHPLRDGTIKPEDFKYKCQGEEYDDYEELGTYEGWEGRAEAYLVRDLSIYIENVEGSKELKV